MPELWLVHPADRVLTIYRRKGEDYGRPEILEFQASTPVTAVPEVVIDWAQVLARLD